MSRANQCFLDSVDQTDLVSVVVESEQAIADISD